MLLIVPILELYGTIVLIVLQKPCMIYMHEYKGMHGIDSSCICMHDGIVVVEIFGCDYINNTI